MLKLIIADDVDTICETMRMYVDNCKLNIEVTDLFYDGVDVIEYIKHNKTDIIITDIKMPGATGIDIAKYVYENNLDTKVIIISAYAEFQFAKQAIAYNVFDFLQKPIDFFELKGTLERVISFYAIESDNNCFSDKLFYTEEAFFLHGLYKNQECEIDKFIKLYPDIDTQKAKIVYYNIQIDNLNEVLHKKWNYENDRLIFAICEVIRLSFVKTDIKYLEFVDFSENNLLIAVLYDEKNFIWENTITDTLRTILFLECSWKCIYEINDLNNINKIEYYEDDKLGIDTEEAIELAKEYIINNSHKSITRIDVANYVGYSLSHFAKIFNESTGITISKYIYEQRMRKVISYLDSDMKIKDIAEITGFKTERQFRRNVEAYTGYGPTEYRKNVLKK